MKKICVYTCITGDYDNLKDIEKEKNIDYYCFTNNKNIKSNKWKIIYIDEELPNVKLARKIKILGHDTINDKYDILIWMDAAVSFKQKITDFINCYYDKEYDLVAFKHGERNTVKEECIECVKVGKETKENVQKLLNFYKKEKFKDNTGLIESTVLIKNGTSKKLKKTMDLWFKMILNFSHRDQLSFNYVITKNDIKIKWIDEKIFDNDWFDWEKHNTYRNIKRYRLYFGDEQNYSFNNDFQNDYEIKKNNYLINIVSPITTDKITIYPSKIGMIVIKEVFFNERKIKPQIKNTRKMDKYYFAYSKPTIIIDEEIVKNQKINIRIVMEILNENEIEKLIEEQASIIDDKNKKIEKLERELKAIYDSKLWKYMQKMKRIVKK